LYTKDRCTELVRNVAFGIGYHAMHHEASKGFSLIYEYPVQLEPAWEEFNPSVSYCMGQPPVSALPAAPSESWYVVQLHIPKCITIDWDRYEFLTASLSTFPAITSFEIVGKQEKATFYIGSSSPTHVAVLADLWRTACPDLLAVPAEDPFPQMESSPEQFFDLYTTAPYYREFTTRSIVSPLTNFIRSLSSLQPNEWAFYQVLFTPVKNNWSINIQSLLQAESVLGAGAPWGKSRLPMVKKHDKPLFAARVRYGCSSENPKVRTALQAFAGQFSFDGQACRFYTRDDFQKILKDPVIHQIRTEPHTPPE